MLHHYSKGKLVIIRRWIWQCYGETCSSILIKITTLILKADEICLSATCYSGRFDAKLIMEKIDMRKEAHGIKTELTSDRICIGNGYLLCSQHGFQNYDLIKLIA